MTAAEPPRSRAEAAAGLRRDPPGTCVISDFDGTLAGIVYDYAAARPLAGALEILERLALVYGRVAVVSGRPASFLAERLGVDGRLPAALRVSGLYGLESVDADGSVRAVAEAETWRDVVAAAADRAEASAPPGVRIERKGLSVTLHWREHPDVEAWALQFAESAGAEFGLGLHAARMSVELRPPLDVDKGTAVTELADQFGAACYLGDDLGDLPAYAALDRLRQRGAYVVKVAVVGTETPPGLVEATDVTVEGPEGALEFLRTLID